MRNFRFKALLFVELGFLAFVLGCGPTAVPEQPKVGKKAEKTAEVVTWGIDDSNTVLDSSGEVPVYRTKFQVPVSDKVELKISLKGLESLKIGGRESLIVPMEGGKEIPEPWPIEGPEAVKTSSLYSVSYSREDLEYRKKKCVAFSNLDGGGSFLIRIIFSDTDSVRRVGLLIVEIMLK